MKKKGQQAMEFMMQYGWAFLVVAAGISALAYFGVFSPKDLIVSKCVYGSGVGCKDFKATEDTVALTLINAFPEELIQANVVFSSDLAECTPAVTPGNGNTWSGVCNGNATNCTFTMDSGVAINGEPMASFSFSNCPDMSKTVHFTSTLNYRTKGHTVTNEVIGDVILKVET
jgi:hypothetical protein